MAYWLVKSEPGSWSWQQHLDAGVTEWDGVRNFQAANNMKAMRLDDQAFFYHSGSERAIVGVVEVVREYYPDSQILRVVSAWSTSRPSDHSSAPSRWLPSRPTPGSVSWR